MQLHYLILLFALLSWGCTESSGVDGDESWELPTTPDEDQDEADDTQNITEWMDGILSTDYLYNDEYNTMTRDVTSSYDAFLGSTLAQMSTNVLDYKDGSLYSTIYRYALSRSQTRSTTKELELSFGFTSGFYVSYAGYSQLGLAVSAVVADSPLDKAGICRGDIIMAVNGVSLSSSNIYTYAELLFVPSSVQTYTLSLYDGREFSVTSEYMYCSPILKSEIYDESVAYLCYRSFEMAYDDELMDVMAQFKSAGVTDLILDLRLNPGGYVDTANKLATSIAGDSSSGLVFMQKEYNPTRMAELSDYYKINHFYGGLSSSHINMSRVYCLVSQYTASASESVINSLRGIGLEVILIGSQTEGKNVGSEVSYKSYGDWYYEFSPITFIASNTDGFSDYSDGFIPDYSVSDWNGGLDFADFSQDEVLIKTALDLISLGSRATSESTRSVGSTSDMIQGEFVFSNGVGGNITLKE